MDAILKNNFQNNLAGYQKVADYTVSGSAISSYDFTGLNITKEDDYMLVSSIVNNGGNSGVFLFANANYTTSNYYTQNITANSSSVAGVRLNNPYLQSTNESSLGIYSYALAKIKLTNNGYYTFQSNTTNRFGSSNTQIENFNTTSTFTTTSITSLRIQSEAASKIGIGSRFQLYKRKAPIIADITVSSATTSVDITGFTMDKGSEYMLVANRVVGSTLVSNADLALFVNDNTTHTNYYYQQLYAGSTTISGERVNRSRWLRGNLGSHFSITNIKLTNNGYFVSQESQIENLSSSIGLNKRYITSTFTLTSITKLSIIAQETNAIGAGSRFQLIKLK